MAHSRVAPVRTPAAPSDLHPPPPGPPTAPARTTASNPVAPGANTSGQRKYAYIGGYDFATMSDILTNHLPAALKADHRWDARSLPHLQILMGLIEADTDVTDLRWAAYMLATTYWETNHTEPVQVPKKDKKGAVMTDKLGNVITRTIKANTTMKPITELGGGAGRRYHRPVKYLALPGGKAQITEYDGDQFTIDTSGTWKAVGNLQNKKLKAAVGTAADAAATKAYTDAGGDERLFIGRGYVQLTWWQNYASAGVILGKGMPFFLDDPEQALEATYAYKLMSVCMRTGVGFANGHKFSDYFSGNDRKYTQARAMVNGTDHADDIKRIAEAFEDILWDSRKVK